MPAEPVGIGKTGLPAGRQAQNEVKVELGFFTLVF